MVSTETMPPNIERVAAERRFGALVVSRGSVSTRSGAAGFIFAAIGAVALGVGIAALAVAVDNRKLGVAALGWICAAAPVLVIWGVRIFARGNQAYFLYEGGLMYVKNGRPTPVAWRDIVEVRRLRLGEKAAEFARGMPGTENVTADAITGYEVRASGGGKLTIHIGGINDPGYAAFCDYFEQAAAQAGARFVG